MKYPCFIKSNINNQQSSINIPPIINETENNEQHNNYKHYLSDNNLNTNEIKKQINIDKILNYGPTLEKNELEENISPNNPSLKLIKGICLLSLLELENIFI